MWRKERDARSFRDGPTGSALSSSTTTTFFGEMDIAARGKKRKVEFLLLPEGGYHPMSLEFSPFKKQGTTPKAKKRSARAVNSGEKNPPCPTIVTRDARRKYSDLRWRGGPLLYFASCSPPGEKNLHLQLPWLVGSTLISRLQGLVLERRPIFLRLGKAAMVADGRGRTVASPFSKKKGLFPWKTSGKETIILSFPFQPPGLRPKKKRGAIKSTFQPGKEAFFFSLLHTGKMDACGNRWRGGRPRNMS